MQQEIKQRIHLLVDSIDDEMKLQLLMEDVQAYITETGESEDDLTNEETDEINESIAQIDGGESVSWEDLKQTMKEWREA